MGFIFLLVLTTLSIAGSAAFFSVYGLASLFSGMFWPVVIMGSSLEAGKLIAASFLYRYWDKITFLLKTYMILAVGVLMLVTSTGIFGFLSQGYQQDVKGIKSNVQQIELIEQENADLQALVEEYVERKKQIDTEISSLPKDYITGRQRLMTAYGVELKQLSADIATNRAKLRENSSKLSELKQTNLHEEAHVGPIVFIAKVFDLEIDDTTKWLILIIIFAFDPLAVALTIGTNIAIEERRKSKKIKLDTPISNQETQPPVSSDDSAEIDEHLKLQIEEMVRRSNLTKQIRQHKPKD